MIHYIFLSLAVSFLLGLVAIPRILLVSYKKKLFDNPNVRKVHHTPVPRLGGLAFMPIIVTAMALCMGVRYRLHEGLAADEHLVFVQFCAVLVGIMMVYMIGVKDDLIGASVRGKFAIQLLAASLFPLSGLWVDSLYGFLGIYEIPWFIGMPLTVFLCVYVTNAINLIDGVDGLASGLCVIGFFVMGVCLYRTNLYVFAMLTAAAVGVLIPFLNFNVRQRRNGWRKIFMGDAGSLTLGYLLTFLFLQLSARSVLNHPDHTGHPFVAFGAFVIPLFDVVRVVMSRYRDGRPLFQPDMNHIHHKCLRTGMSPRQTMLFLLGMSCVFVCVNLVLRYVLWANVIFMDVLIWVVMHEVLNRFIAKKEAQTGRVWSRKYGRYLKE